MNSMELAEFTLNDGTVFLVEVDPPKGAVQKVARDGQIISKGKESLEVLLEKVKPVASTILNKLRGLNTPADEVEVKFGLKLSADLGVVFATSGSEVTFEITLKWANPEKSTDRKIDIDEFIQ